MWRKRASPAPFFKQSSPLSPISGQFAGIGTPNIHSRITMFQVTEDDTHDDYIVCQGWDLDTDSNCAYLIKSIPVAKPFYLRGTFPYAVANIVAAVKARTVLGDNSGVASVSTGQPATLEEEINILYDDDGTPISWLTVDAPAYHRFGQMTGGSNQNTETPTSLILFDSVGSTLDATVTNAANTGGIVVPNDGQTGAPWTGIILGVAGFYRVTLTMQLWGSSPMINTSAGIQVNGTPVPDVVSYYNLIPWSATGQEDPEPMQFSVNGIIQISIGDLLQWFVSNGDEDSMIGTSYGVATWEWLGNPQFSGIWGTGAE